MRKDKIGSSCNMLGTVQYCIVLTCSRAGPCSGRRGTPRELEDRQHPHFDVAVRGEGEGLVECWLVKNSLPALLDLRQSTPPKEKNYKRKG